MYLVVSYTRSHGRVISDGLSLVDAYRLVNRLGHGAVFRSEGLSPYARPVYPLARRGGTSRRTAAAGPHAASASLAAVAAAFIASPSGKGVSDAPPPLAAIDSRPPVAA